MEQKNNKPLFVIDPTPTVKWPVIVAIPSDGGALAEFQFTGVFKRMSEEEYDAILEENTAKLGPQENLELVSGISTAGVLKNNAGFFPKLMVGWEDVRNAQGQDVEFSVELLKEQVTGTNGVFLSHGIWQAIYQIRNGARLGN